jgi:4-alpha-glucanotransferase
MRQQSTTQPYREPKLAKDRRSGVLLHPTCFPSPSGIGDLGREAYAFIDVLHATHQQLWQVLPLGPTVGGSPYSALSANAGNPLLINLGELARDGFLDVSDAWRTDGSTSVDFDRVAHVKLSGLRAAFGRFMSTSSRRDSLSAFCAEQSDWLDDYALFMALKDAQGQKAWNLWPKSLATGQTNAMAQANRELADEVAFHQYTQYVFFSQWAAVRSYAHKHGISIVGDIPFYVALDSVDVWSHPRNFALDEITGEPRLVGGVPPDSFSKTGQLWNMPVYNWRHMQETGFAWWVDRFQKLLQIVDIIRIDHFRGFSAYWQVRQGASTAVEGEWVEAPGVALFTTLRDKLGHVPIWAEDLGLITTEVKELREQFGFPGMNVLQFAFDDEGAANRYLPYHYERNCVCYTATHDNDTTRGWWAQLEPNLKRRVSDYLGGTNERDIHWAFIRLAMSSVANDVIIPWQDVLGLGSEARLNVPGTTTGNWTWRFDDPMITPEVRERLSRLTAIYGRRRSA